MANVYVHGSKEIPGDSWVAWVNASGQDVQTQPINMTSTQMTRAGVTVVAEAPMPDPFYGPVVKDPNNPGQWIQTLYTPDEMKLRLEDYSSGKRNFFEQNGQVVHSAGGNYGIPTSRDVRPMYTNALKMVSDGVQTSARVKAMRIKTTSPLVFGSVLWINANLAKLNEIVGEMNKYTDLCFVTENTLFTDIEAGTVTIKDQIDARYQSMQDTWSA